MDTIADTIYGKVKGEHKSGYLQFLGIPFAKPPVGELRFRKPQKPDSWDGIKECMAFGAYCCQPGIPDVIDKRIPQSEDCLTLNIFTPACDGKKRPVAIWIHGGAYLTGNACSSVKLGGRFCREADIVVVTIQYRLGAFGCVDFSQLSGAHDRFDTNCGTWDQVAAVDWVIDNIINFGGDPKNIGLMGESAGACSVLTLITTPYLKGKIRRAVLESPAPNLILSREEGQIAALDVIRYLGVSEDEAYKIADFSADVLTDAVNKSEYHYVNYRPYLLPTAPVVDGDLIPELPFDAVMHGVADGIDILIGTTKDEGTIFARGKDTDIFPATEEQMERFFRKNPSVNREEILALYPDYPNLKACQNIGKEIFFHLGTLALAEHWAKKGRVFVYHYDYATPILRLLKAGAAHCANSALTSGEFSGFLGWFSGKKGDCVERKIQAHWDHFLATGNPNAVGTEEWPEYGENQNTYFIDVESHVEQKPFTQEREAYRIIRPYKN